MYGNKWEGGRALLLVWLDFMESLFYDYNHFIQITPHATISNYVGNKAKAGAPAWVHKERFYLGYLLQFLHLCIWHRESRFVI